MTQTTFDSSREGDAALLSTIEMMRRARLQHFPREVTSRRPRLCCCCLEIIWPGQRHRSWPVKGRQTGRLSDRRMHLRCRREEDPFPEYGPAERGALWFERIIAAVGVAFALAVLAALWMALGYQW